MAIARRALDHPCVYDWIQALAGGRQVHRRLAPYLADTDGQVVMDLGAGTGGIIPLISPTARYIALDIDPGKVHGLRRRYPAAHALLGSATALPFASGEIDIVVCKAVAHHLPPPALALALRECARVCRGRFIFLDAVRVPGRFLSSAFWRYDLGRFPYTEDELGEALTQHFELERVERFTVYHRYLLCSARPKRKGATH